MNRAELNAYRVVINESGKLFFSDGSIVNGKAIFVMDQNGIIYAHTGFESTLLNGKFFRHSSFLAGEPVAAAGEMEILNGSLLKISRKSGHYSPSRKALDQFLNELKKERIDISKIKLERGF